MKDIMENAKKYFHSGYNCAEATLQAGADHFDLDCCTPAAAAAFGGGVSGRGHVCGAVTGTLMVIGLRYGRNGQTEDRNVAAAKARDLLDYVDEKYGSLMCRNLCHLDFSITPKTSPEAMEARQEICTPLVMDLCRWQLENL